MDLQHLSQEGAQRITRDLEGFGEKTQRRFVFRVELLLKTARTLKENPGAGEHRERLSDDQKTLEEALAVLRRYATGRTDPSPQQSFDQTRGEEAAQGLDLMVATVDSSTEAHNKVLEVIQLLEEAQNLYPPQSRGRPPADKDGFVAELAQAFREEVATPTRSETGPFFGVTQVALEELGEPVKDPSRAIRKALTG